MSEKQFKKGQAVKFTNSRGRSGEGKIAEIVNTGKGDWFRVKQADGTIASVRASQMSAA